MERSLARSYFCRRYSFLSAHPWIHRESISKRYYRVEIFIGPLAPDKDSLTPSSTVPWTIWRRYFRLDGPYLVYGKRLSFGRNEYVAIILISNFGSNFSKFRCILISFCCFFFRELDNLKKYE